MLENVEKYGFPTPWEGARGKNWERALPFRAFTGSRGSPREKGQVFNTAVVLVWTLLSAPLLVFTEV